MLGLIIAYACLGLDGGSVSSLSPEDQAIYQAAKAKAGRSADAHVSLALWCEAHGLPRERLEHLAMATTLDPENAAARGLMGVVQDDGRWRNPQDVIAKVQSDPASSATLSEYNDRRARAEETADSQWNLAIWCEQHGLAEQARAHLVAVVRADPSRDAAWKRLGCKKMDGRWLSQIQIDARKAESEAQRSADRLWTTRFNKIKSDLKKAATHDEALLAIADVHDPRCVPSLMRAFGTNDPRDLAILVQVLGQTDGVAASRALAYVAMNADDAEIRRTASETLRRRDPREFADDLIAAIRPQVKYEVKPVGGPGSPGVLLVEGETVDRRRFYAPPAAPIMVAGQDDRWTTDDQGLPVLMQFRGMVAESSKTANVARADLVQQIRNADAVSVVPRSSPNAAQLNDAARQVYKQEIQKQINDLDLALFASRGSLGTNVTTGTVQYDAIPVGQMEREARKAALFAQQQLEADVAQIDASNRQALVITERATDVLRAVSGEDFGENRNAWSKWSTDNRGYAMVLPSIPSRPLVDEVVPLNYTPAAVPIATVNGPAVVLRRSHSCFAAGTLVRTRTGDRPIETLAAGDVALVQDPSTGAMSFEPIVAVYHNPPNSTLRITVDDDTVVATGIHRFWKAGTGWTMARDLKPGDRIRTLAGTATVSRVEPGPVQLVFNLEVAKGRSFFVGKIGALVHDNSLVETISKPFDAVPSLAVAKPEGGPSR